MNNILILSKKLSMDLQSEVGNLPNSFIPIGNKRLYEILTGIISNTFKNYSITIVLPEDYIISEFDLLNLKKLNIEIFTTSNNDTGKQVYSFISKIKPKGTLKVIYCDTLFDSLPTEEDCVALALTSFNFDHVVEQYNSDHDIIWAGFFSFSDSRLIKKIIKEENYDFNRSVQSYSFQMKMIKPTIGKWHYLGNTSSYFKTRSHFASARFFNSITVFDNVLTKCSKDNEKIKQEANWFINAPTEIKKFLPSFYEFKDLSGKSSYSIEYISALTLNELFTNCQNNILFWKNIFVKLSNYLNSFNSTELKDPSAFLGFVYTKSFERLYSFEKNTSFCIRSKNFFNGYVTPSLIEILEISLKKCEDLSYYSGFTHGDFCFSNILYDTKSDTIKLIDPRGNIPGSALLPSYDYAKLTHSIIGLYDHIIAGRFELELKGNNFKFKILTEEHTQDIIRLYTNQFKAFNKSPDYYAPLMLTLFISMLPLHSDVPERQKALIANSLRIYLDYIAQPKP